MPVFEYQAIRVGGEAVSGIVTADSPRQAREQLRSQEIYVTELSSPGQGKARGDWFRAPAVFKLNRLREVALMSRQLATMLSSGIPIADALNALVEQVEDRRLRSVVREVREKVLRGLPLAEALAEHPEYFEGMFTGMVHAGEAGGNLDQVLQLAGEICQREYHLRSRISSLLIYPCILMAAGTAVVVFLLTYIIPQITRFLEESRAPMPLSTEMLVHVSDSIRTFWPHLLALFLALALGFQALVRTDRGGFLFDWLKLKLPIMGNLFRKHAASHFTGVLAALLKSGLPALEALAIVKGVVGNRAIVKAIDGVIESLTAGQDLSTPLRNSGIFPPMVSYMVATGEQSGELDVLLERVSRELDEEVEMVGQRLIALLEPVIIVMMAVVVAFIVLSIVQPILELSNF